MENNETPQHLTAAEAREALDLADRAEAPARRPTLPTWFFPAMAALVAALLLAQLLEDDQRTTLMLGSVVVALLLNSWVQRSSGISWATFGLAGQLPFLVAIVAVIAGTAVAVAATEQEWIWALGAAGAAAVVLVTGVIYRRRAARGA